MNQAPTRPYRTLACACGADQTRDSFVFKGSAESGPHEYARCTRCGLWRMIDQPDDATLAAAYLGTYYGSGRRKFIGPVAWLVSLAQCARARFVLKRLKPDRPRILDIGCGNGGFLAVAASMGAVCEGTEFSHHSAARAAEAGLTVHVTGLEALVSRGERYDAITLWHVIEHLRDPEETIRCAAALLGPRGALFVSAPNHDSWQSKVFRERWFHLDPPRHLWGFSPKSLAMMIERHGFAIQFVTTVSMEQNPYGMLQSVLNSLGFPHNRAYETLKGLDHTWSSRLVDFVCVAGLALPCIVAASIEAAMARGGTFCLVGRKENDVPE